MDRCSDHIVCNDKVKKITKLKDRFTIKEGVNKTIDFYEMNNMFLGVDYEYDGKLDRMINDSGLWQDKLRFISYDKYSIKNKLSYCKGYYYDSPFLIIVRRIKMIASHIRRVVKKVFSYS